MAEPRTREELEAEWWEEWWRRDYSWSGLKRRGIGGDYRLFKSKGPHEEVTLQDYWRRDPKTGAIRSDEVMLEVGELCRDGDDGKKLWHIAHVPLNWRSKQPGKESWDAVQRMKLYEVLQLRLKNTEISRDGVDGRAQFFGIVLDAVPLLAASSEDGKPLKTARVSCKNAWFHNLDAEGYRFSEDADFSDALVLGFADFRKAYFEKQFIANSALFCGWGSFENSIFQGNVELKRSVFLERADFENANVKAKFDVFRSTFEERTIFDNVIFAGYAELSYAVFRKGARFSDTEFQDRVDLVRTRFEKESTFTGTKFLQDANFSYSIFADFAIFNRAKFSRDISFVGSIFSKGAFFKGIEAWSPDPHFLSRAFFDVQASGTLSFAGSPLPPFGAFHGLRLDSGALIAFDDPGSKATLTSFNEQLSRIKDTKENASGSKEKRPPDQANRLLDDLAGGCRVLKKYFESQGDRERSQRFFRLELEARMKSDEVGRLERLIFWAYRGSSDYGASIGRPLLWLACSVPCFAILYWIIAAACLNPISSQTDPIGEPYPIQTISEVSDMFFKGDFSEIDTRPMLGALSFSAHRAFPFGAWDVKAEGKDNNMRKLLLGDGEGGANFTVRVLATIQTTFSLAMIFLSGLAIRRRFKMD